ncbi:MAG: DNA replication/repair protein RecF [Candidatus Saccharimonadota bacterium]
MTSIQSLHVKHIRSHREYSIEFSPEVTIITGANGSGKTSLLEAVYISLQGTSFRGSDGDLLQKDSPWWKIDVVLNDQQTRTIKYDPAKTPSRKQFVIDSKTTARIPAKLKHPVVLFDPDDLRLLHGSPTRRRQFIDRFISQLNPLYGPALRKYERAMKQRNNLLKSAYISDDQLFAWNIALAEHGAYIIEQRIAFIEQINQNLSGLYQSIAGTHDEVSIHYSHTFVGDIKQKLLNELHAHAERDRALGNTSVGPHRHDVIFQINTSPALSTASRGEARTIVLALKFLEVDIIERLTGKQPIILLDDVFSELDASRQKLLTSQLKGHQIIITSATSHAGKHLVHVELKSSS